MIWFGLIMIWLILIRLCYMVVKRTQGTATNPRLIQNWLGSGQTLGHCFAYDAVRAATLHYPFSRDEVDGTGEPRLLAGSSEASNASTSVAVLESLYGFAPRW